VTICRAVYNPRRHNCVLRQVGLSLCVRAIPAMLLHDEQNCAQSVAVCRVKHGSAKPLLGIPFAKRCCLRNPRQVVPSAF